MFKNNFRSEINSFEDFDHIAISTDTLMQAFIKYQQAQLILGIFSFNFTAIITGIFHSICSFNNGE